MKSVGVKVLKNNLSRYLRMVKEGETILVTERDEVIAEIHEPSVKSAAQISPWVAYLNRLEREGSLRRATRKEPTVKALLAEQPKWPDDLDWGPIYEDIRSDRF
jgi:antitoxin (DNA-binding transcriptional repressor) of toxin-antitoxin stability system